MKQLTWSIVALAGVAACGSAMGLGPSSRESSGVIKPAPDKPAPEHIGTQGVSPVPEPAREPSSGNEVLDFCASVDREARGADKELSPAPEGRVIGEGRLHFHIAPKPGCRNRNRFIIPGDSVVALSRFGKWMLIDYVSRDGVTHSAWVDASRIDLTAPLEKP